LFRQPSLAHLFQTGTFYFALIGTSHVAATHGSPPKVDLNEASAAAKVLDELVDVGKTRAGYSGIALQYGFILKRKRRRNDRPPLAFFERLQQAPGCAEAGSERGDQDVRVNYDLKHI
jgi:hypothetical protein